MPRRTPWIFKLPAGLREQPGWVFIGALVAITGMSFLLGLSSSNAQLIIGQNWLRGWGGLLVIAGGLVAYSTVTANKPLEKLALRIQSVSLMLYLVWILSAIPLSRATVTIALCVCLVVLSEIRIAVLKVLLRPLPKSARTVAD